MVFSDRFSGELDLAVDGLEEPPEGDDEDIVEHLLLGHAFEAGVFSFLFLKMSLRAFLLILSQ